jgi:hypothetical protein
MKRPFYSALAALAVSAALVGSAQAAEKATQSNTQVASTPQTQAASPVVSRDTVRGAKGEVHILKRSAIPDGWWKDE